MSTRVEQRRVERAVMVALANADSPLPTISVHAAVRKKGWTPSMVRGALVRLQRQRVVVETGHRRSMWRIRTAEDDRREVIAKERRAEERALADYLQRELGWGEDADGPYHAGEVIAILVRAGVLPSEDFPHYGEASRDA